MKPLPLLLMFLLARQRNAVNPLLLLFHHDLFLQDHFLHPTSDIRLLLIRSCRRRLLLKRRYRLLQMATERSPGSEITPPILHLPAAMYVSRAKAEIFRRTSYLYPWLWLRPPIMTRIVRAILRKATCEPRPPNRFRYHRRLIVPINRNFSVRSLRSRYRMNLCTTEAQGMERFCEAQRRMASGRCFSPKHPVPADISCLELIL
jgi:hypothetical protein